MVPDYKPGGNSLDKLHHLRSVAYSAELVLLNKQQISGGGACLHCYQVSELKGSSIFVSIR